MSMSGLTMLTLSCTHKDELSECMGACTTITGRLVTANGKEAISGADVAIKWVYGSAYQPKARVKATGTTDANGNYKITFPINDNELMDGFFEVFYSVDKSRYYTIGEDGVALYKLKRDTTVKIASYVIPRKAYVRLAITNQNQLLAAKPNGEYLSDFNTCYGFNNVFSKNIQGGGPVIFWDDLPSENPVPIAGDQPVMVIGFKTKDGVTTYSTDSLFVAAGTTKTYTVTY